MVVVSFSELSMHLISCQHPNIGNSCDVINFRCGTIVLSLSDFPCFTFRNPSQIDKGLQLPVQNFFAALPLFVVKLLFIIRYYQ